MDIDKYTSAMSGKTIRRSSKVRNGLKEIIFDELKDQPKDDFREVGWHEREIPPAELASYDANDLEIMTMKNFACFPIHLQVEFFARQTDIPFYAIENWQREDLIALGKRREELKMEGDIY